MRRLLAWISAVAGAAGALLAVAGWLLGEPIVAYAGLGLLGVLIAAFCRPAAAAHDGDGDPDAVYEERMREQWSGPPRP